MDSTLILGIALVCLIALLCVLEFFEFIHLIRNFPREVRKRPELLIALLIIVAMFIIGSPPVRDKLFGFGKPHTETVGALTE